MPQNKFQASQAVRELIWTKLALMSPSGGGKTYSSLRLATGMLEKLTEMGLQQNGRILLANTEQKRGYYYANEFKYDIVNMEAPHSPERYVELIEWAVSEQYPIIIIDSTTHEWEGKGGALALHQEAGGTFQSWAKVTPRHNNFLIAIADSPIHVIATMRGNDQYEITDDKKVKKLGVGAQQRKGFEYEFTASFMLDQQTNIATPQKDNTHLFEHDSRVLTEKDGKKVIEWSQSGEGYNPPVRQATESSNDTATDLKVEIKNLVSQASAAKMQKYKSIFLTYDESGNPNKVKNPNDQLKMLEEMKAVIE